MVLLPSELSTAAGELRLFLRGHGEPVHSSERGGRGAQNVRTDLEGHFWHFVPHQGTLCRVSRVSAEDGGELGI